MNAPGHLFVPELYAGRSARIVWEPATGAEGYVLQRRINGGFDDAEEGLTWLDLEGRYASWTDLEGGVGSWGFLYDAKPDWEIYRGEELSFLDEIPWSAATVAYRVAAFRDGEPSQWADSDTLAVTPNRPPEISGEDGSLGMRAQAFSISFTVSDPDPEETLTLRAHLEGQLLWEREATGQEPPYTVTVEDAVLQSLVWGKEYELVLSATDRRGLESRRRYTFTAAENLALSCMFYVLRDGEAIAKLDQMEEWVDYTQTGSHTYVVRCVDPDDNFVDSNPVTLTTTVNRAVVANLAQPRQWVELTLREGQRPVVDQSYLIRTEALQFEGRTLPVAVDSGHREGVWTLRFTHCGMEEYGELLALAAAGEPVIYRDLYGNRFVGVIESKTSSFTRRGGRMDIVDFTVQLVEIDSSEEISYD